MNSNTFLTLYLNANILLVASYCFFLVFRKLAIITKLVAPHRHLISVAQILIAVSLLTPLAFHSISTQRLPKIEWGILNSASEMKASISRRMMRSSKVHRNNSTTQKITQPKPDAFEQFTAWIQSHFAMFFVLGSLVFLARLISTAFRLNSLVKHATPVRMIGRVRVVVSDMIAIPFSLLLGRVSWVVLPTNILENANDFRLALRHELQHHRQHDTVWAIIVELFICFFFPNPAIYFWKKQIIELQEFSCDEALIGHKNISSHEYGSCLVRVAETALGARNMYVGTTCMSAVSKNPFYLKSFLRRRIEMFTKHKNPNTHKWAGVIIGTATAMLTMALAFGAERILRSGALEPSNSEQVIVDADIQKITDRVLAKAIQDEGATAGFAIVADPHTGKILAIANIDTTNKLSGYWSLRERFEPASIVKTLIAATAIDKGLTTPQEKLKCENGSYRYGDRVYHDWKKTGWDTLSTEDTIAWSSDICTIKLSERVGRRGLVDMLESFGFGPEGTALAYPQAIAGQLPPADDAEHPRLVPYVSMGAGFTTTPIEMIQAYGAIVNGGNLMLPKTANTPDSEAKVVRRVMSTETSEKVKNILQQVVLKGTAKAHANSKLFTTAGKTATSHYPRHLPFDSDADFAAFIGFAPMKDPRIEIYVGMREPKSPDGAHGSTHAAPVFKELADEVLKFMKVAPDQI